MQDHKNTDTIGLKRVPWNKGQPFECDPLFSEAFAGLKGTNPRAGDFGECPGHSVLVVLKWDTIVDYFHRP